MEDINQIYWNFRKKKRTDESETFESVKSLQKAYDNGKIFVFLAENQENLLSWICTIFIVGWIYLLFLAVLQLNGWLILISAIAVIFFIYFAYKFFSETRKALVLTQKGLYNFKNGKATFFSWTNIARLEPNRFKHSSKYSDIRFHLYLNIKFRENQNSSIIYEYQLSIHTFSNYEIYLNPAYIKKTLHLSSIESDCENIILAIMIYWHCAMKNNSTEIKPLEKGIEQKENLSNQESENEEIEDIEEIEEMDEIELEPEQEPNKMQYVFDENQQELKFKTALEIQLYHIFDKKSRLIINIDIHRNYFIQFSATNNKKFVMECVGNENIEKENWLKPEATETINRSGLTLEQDMTGNYRKTKTDTRDNLISWAITQTIFLLKNVFTQYHYNTLEFEHID